MNPRLCYEMQRIQHHSFALPCRSTDSLALAPRIQAWQTKRPRPTNAKPEAMRH